MTRKKALIIVESPAKIKTLKKFLGGNFLFASSFGHVRDLPKKGFGIDVENDFEPEYEIVPDKKKVIDELRKLAKQCDIIYLSPDPDREGEAIAWHIAALLSSKAEIKRTAFNAITKEAVLSAIENPQEIDLSLVNAQQARRLLDRIVGYKISPLLARKLYRRSGLSAGRVQSVALKLIVDREKEIERFKPVEYWNIGANLLEKKAQKSLFARLVEVEGKKVEKEPIPGKELCLISNKETAATIVAKLKQASFKVEKVERKEKRRNPEPPFITSTLQQEASRHLRFSPVRTMNIAQGLYEGVDLDKEESEGLITYMRTDSVRVEMEALQEARKFILSKYSKEHLPASPRFYTSKKSAQDAHEAIRPTNVHRSPDKVQPYLTREQFLLYDLIWKRFVASQMSQAIYDTVSADIATDKNMWLRVNGSTLKFSGYLALYEEKKDEQEEEQKEVENQPLPLLEEGQLLDLLEIISEQSFTKPPPRFSEASLVKELEKSGIGRPSTYASIMQKIQSREYTEKERDRIKPTMLGRVIAEFLEANFHEIMDINFTATMEDSLELVASGKKEWKEVIRDFWKTFTPTLEVAQASATIPKIDTEIPCPKCGKHLQKIFSKSNYFYGCSGYPECDFRASIGEMQFQKEDYKEGFNWDQLCPLCGSAMKVRHGKFGTFLGCSKYPECKGLINIPKKGEQEETLPSCPAIGCTGQIVKRKSRFGKPFYACSTFPECDVIANSLDQLEEKYVSHPKTAYIKKAGKKGEKPKKTATKAKKTKEPKKMATKTKKKASTGLALSKELATFLGAESLSLGAIMKGVWEYIKAHDLQDPKNKKTILPDKKLGKILGSQEPVDMFALPKLISKHFKK